MTKDNLSRRAFLKTTTAIGTASGAVGLLGVPAPIRAAGANQGLRIGLLGTGERVQTAHAKVLLQMQKVISQILC